MFCYASEKKMQKSCFSIVIVFSKVLQLELVWLLNSRIVCFENKQGLCLLFVHY